MAVWSEQVDRLQRGLPAWPALMPRGLALTAEELGDYVWGRRLVVDDSRALILGVPGCPRTRGSFRDDGILVRNFEVVDPHLLAAWVGRARDAFVLGDDWRLA